MNYYPAQYKFNQQPNVFNQNNNCINIMGKSMGNININKNNIDIGNKTNFDINNINVKKYNNGLPNDYPNVNNTGLYNYNINMNNKNTIQQKVYNAPRDEDFTQFDDCNRNTIQHDSNKPLSKLLDPKLVNLDNLKGTIQPYNSR